MKIEYSRASLKLLKKQDRKTVSRMRHAITGLTNNPPVGDIKPLKGFSDGRKRLRIGGWRIVYRYETNGDETILYIIDIGDRGDVYK